MENRGFSFRSILFHSLWTTLTGILFFSLSTTKRHNFTGILFFSLSTTKRHNFGYIKFFSVTGTLLITLPWMIQLLVTSLVIFLHKTRGYDLMWIVQSPKSKENHQETVVTISSPSSPLPSRQVVKKGGDADGLEIRILIGNDGPRSPKDGSTASPTIMEIEGRNNTKLLTNGSPVA